MRYLSLLVLLCGCDPLEDASSANVILDSLRGSYELVELELVTPADTVVATNRDTPFSQPATGTTQLRIEGRLEVEGAFLRRVHGWVQGGERTLGGQELIGQIRPLSPERFVVDAPGARHLPHFRFAFLDDELLELWLEPPEGCLAARAPERRWRFRRVPAEEHAGALHGLLSGSGVPLAILGTASRRSLDAGAVLLGGEDGVSRVGVTVVLPEGATGELVLMPQGSLEDAETSNLVLTSLPTNLTAPAVVLSYVDRFEQLVVVAAEDGRIAVEANGPEAALVRIDWARFETPMGRFPEVTHLRGATLTAGWPLKLDAPPPSCRPALDALDAPVEGRIVGQRFVARAAFLRRRPEGLELELRSSDTPCGIEESFVGSQRIQVLLEGTSEPEGLFELGGSFEALLISNAAPNVELRSLVSHGLLHLEGEKEGVVRGQISLWGSEDGAEGVFSATWCDLP